MTADTLREFCALSARWATRTQIRKEPPKGAPTSAVAAAPRGKEKMGALTVFPVSLTFLALVWVSGPVSAETVGVRSSSLPLTVPASDYLPEYTRGLNVDGLAGYTLADLRLANAHFKPSQVPAALMVSYCESRHDDTKVGAAGERGRYQIHPDVWLGLNGWPGDPAVRGIVSRYGPVSPDTLALPDANAAVASYIVNEFGWSPWTTRNGCHTWQ